MLVRKIVIGIVGSLLVILGLVMIVVFFILPELGIIVLIAGLAVLSLEFEWAKRQKQKLIAKAEELKVKIRKKIKK